MIFRWWYKSSHINAITPFSSHDKNGVCMHSGTNQWIHLCHEAAQPTVKRTRKLHYDRSCGSIDLRNTYNSQQVAAVNINTHWTILFGCKEIEKINGQFIGLDGVCNYFQSVNLFGNWTKTTMTHPRFGPFGARNGKTMPTTPHNAVKMITGTTPIV